MHLHSSSQASAPMQALAAGAATAIASRRWCRCAQITILLVASRMNVAHVLLLLACAVRCCACRDVISRARCEMRWKPASPILEGFKSIATTPRRPPRAMSHWAAPVGTCLAGHMAGGEKGGSPTSWPTAIACGTDVCLLTPTYRCRTGRARRSSELLGHPHHMLRWAQLCG